MSGAALLPPVRPIERTPIADLVTAVRRPGRALARIRRLVGSAQNRLLGTAVMDEEWDNLVILDGCRYDTFASLHELPGRLERRRSRGSATEEFVRNNFVGRQFLDTVYVSANPYVSRLAGDAFHYLEPTWRTRWDEDLGTVPPGPMTEAVLAAAERFPDKRLVAHYMQPHHPFLGPTAERELSGTSGNEHARVETIEGSNAAPGAAADDHVWALVRDGRVEPSVVRRAYTETLERVFPRVEQLCEELPGMTVVTSDHGNLFDEPAYGVLAPGTRRFSHPRYATAPALVTVPWYVHPFESRKEIVPEPAVPEPLSDSTDAVDDRLEALGYQ